MKQILLIIGLLGATAMAAEYHKHPTHNMVLFGKTEVFASHIVYKEPHNFQVILSLNLDQATKKAYLDSKNINPSDLQILLLDPMDIENIRNLSQISGKLLTENSKGERQIIVENVIIVRQNFEVVFLGELPVGLQTDFPFASLNFGESDDYTCVRRPVLKCEPGETAYLCTRPNGKPFAKCQ